MQKYVTQLLEDLAAAKGNLPPKPNVRVLYPDHPALDFGLDYIAEWECAPSVRMNDLFGIDAVVFPDANKLSDEQLSQLIEAILELWATFHFEAVIPDETPLNLVYSALVKKWREDPVQYVSEGVSGLEFCHYEPTECPWGMEHCSCKDFDDDDFDMDKYKMTPEQEAEWNKGVTHHPNGGVSWISPELLDENGNFDPSKLDKLMGGDKEGLPF
jgi:hypothetical protein